MHKHKTFIRTDCEKLHAVLSNLVENAIKFTPSGYVEMGYEVMNGSIEFYVKDSGPGISERQKKSFLSVSDRVVIC